MMPRPNAQAVLSPFMMATLVLALLAGGLTAACQAPQGSAEPAAPAGADAGAAVPEPSDAPGTTAPSAAYTIPSEDLVRLLAATRSAAAAAEGTVEPLLERARKVPPTEPVRPLTAYLVGEIERLRDRPEPARRSFRELVEWAARDPYGDTWGASALAGLALWRWLEALETADSPDEQEARRALELAETLAETRLFRGLTTSGLLPALPRLEEEIARQRAHLAWKLGDRDAATNLFFDYLGIASSPRLDAADRQLRQAVIDAKLATAERLDLLRASRLLSLVRTQEHREEALALLERVLDASEPQVRAEARYQLAYEKRRQQDHAELIAWLDQALVDLADRDHQQRALYLRAMTRNRSGDDEGFRRDLETLIAEHPDGRLADDALHQLGAGAIFAGDLERGDEYYRRLRRFETRNDFQDSAAYIPALGFIARGGPGDLERADRLLAEYLESYPAGVFSLRSIFWRGRIAETRGASAAAREHFQRVVTESPWDYYAVRARMHLEDGIGASRRAHPSAGSKTRGALRDAYRASRIETELGDETPYHARVRRAIESGLYRAALASDAELLRWQKERASDDPPRRLDDLALEDLDQAGLLPSLGLLLALRLDAEAARDAGEEVASRLRLAGAVGARAGDWPAALGLATVRSTEPAARRRELESDPRYLATVYPAIFRDEIRAAAGDYRRVTPSLLYSVMRQESRFYPAAISNVGALGLFQFMAATFDGLDREWRLLETAGVADRTGYLLAPERSIRLWARWAEERILRRHDGDLVLALMDHQAGSGNVQRWQRYWREIGKEDDVELVIETARFPATRNFVRHVLEDMWVVEAAGFLSAGSAPAE